MIESVAHVINQLFVYKGKVLCMLYCDMFHKVIHNKDTVKEAITAVSFSNVIILFRGTTKAQ